MDVAVEAVGFQESFQDPMDPMVWVRWNVRRERSG